MGKKLLHTCDKCGHTQDKFPHDGTKEQHASGELRFFAYVGIYSGDSDPRNIGPYPAARSYIDQVKHSQYWCSHCAISAGIRLKQWHEPGPTPPAKSSLEDMIREIARSVVEENKHDD